MRIVAETDGLTDVVRASVDGFDAEQCPDERRLAGSVVTYDAELLVARKSVVEMVENLVGAK